MEALEKFNLNVSGPNNKSDRITAPDPVQIRVRILRHEIKSLVIHIFPVQQRRRCWRHIFFLYGPICKKLIKEIQGYHRTR
jgi:hypothetical protein